MKPETQPVKRRSYDASSRQARARQQHESVLEIARQRFLEHGYTATTVETIARAAGISAATIYKSYGGKAGLVRELCRRALEGEGPVPAEQRSNALRAADDPRVIVDGWGRLVAEISPLGAPLYNVLRAAAEHDAEAATLADELDASRLTRMADNARHLAGGGHLRTGVTVRDARDVLWLSSAPELYDLLVTRRGWSAAKLGRFAADIMRGALLDER